MLCSRRVVRAILMAGILVGVLVPGPTGVGAAPATFQGLVPARLVDTRPSGQTVDGQSQGTGPLGVGAVLTLTTLGRGGIPASGVGAVALNVTAINPSAASFLTVYPTGAALPTASNLNLAPGRTLPNMVVVPVGTDGQVNVYNDQGTTHLAVDVLGWFPEDSFNGLVPARLADTRPNRPTVDGVAQGQGALGPSGLLQVPVLGRSGIPGSGVAAVALNVTAINPSAASFLTVFPADANRPTASNLNLAPGRTLPNMVIVSVGTGGQVSVYNDQGSTHVAVDVLGWFPDGSFTGLTPARVADTRMNGTTIDGRSQRQGSVGPGQSLALPLVGRAGVPGSGVGAVALNVTAVNPGWVSFVTVHPSGSDRPNASNLNLAADRTLPNMVIVPVGPDGVVTIYNEWCDTHLVVDVLGWFAGTVAATPPAPPPASGFATDPSTTRVSLASDCTRGTGGPSTPGLIPLDGSPSISADGRYVAFDSGLPNLVPGDTNNTWDVFVHDRITRTTTRVSVGPSGLEANSGSYRPSISADGRYVAFSSWASNLVTGDTNGTGDIFVHDRSTATTTRVSVASGGAQGIGEGGATDPATSADGRYVAFASDMTNLVPGDTNNVWDVFVHDRMMGATERVSVSSNGSQAGMFRGSFGPSISADGRYVAFGSQASDFSPGTTPDRSHVYVRDRVAGTTTRVSVGLGGAEPNGDSFLPSLSANGLLVSFTSRASNLVAGDSNFTDDIFLFDRFAGTTTRVSVATGGAQGNNSSVHSQISGDGRFVAFGSSASTLVTPDTNGTTDVFVHEIATGTTTRVSVATGGAQAIEGMSHRPTISWDGRFVAFQSLATNLVPADTNDRSDVFVRDRGI